MKSEEKGIGTIIKAFGQLAILAGVIFLLWGIIGYASNQPIKAKKTGNSWKDFGSRMDTFGENVFVRPENREKAKKRMIWGVVITAVGGGIIWVSGKAPENV